MTGSGAGWKCQFSLWLYCSRMTDLDVRQLRTFVAVAELGNFTSAAARLQTSQPNVSRTVASLERTLGVRLLERSTHDCALTQAGEVLLARARLVLESVELAVSLTRRAAGPARRLIIAVKPDSDAGLLPQILDRYERHPDCPPAELLFRETPGLTPAVRAGDADIALVTGPCDTGGLDAEELWHEQRLAVLPAAHRLAGRQQLTICDFAGQPVICWPALPTELDRYYRGADQLPPGQPGQGGPSATSLAEALRLVELGRGVTYLPDSVARRFQRPGLTARPVHGLSGSTALLAWRSGSRDRAVAAFSQAAFQAARAGSRTHAV
jgi:DNA-binding transcriptional LysR family regulator